MDGGGLHGAVPLTADLVARAVIAAARIYGDDPVRAMTAKTGKLRQSLTPACEGVSYATGASFKRVARILGIREQNRSRAEERGGEAFRRAVAAANIAVRDALGGAMPPPLPAPCLLDNQLLEDQVHAPATVAATRPAVAGHTSPRPGQPTRRITPLAARREILKILALEPCTGPDLMEVLALGEGQVRQALRELCEEREVTHTPLNAEGWRGQFWRLPDGARA